MGVSKVISLLTAYLFFCCVFLKTFCTKFNKGEFIHTLNFN